MLIKSLSNDYIKVRKSPLAPSLLHPPKLSGSCWNPREVQSMILATYSRKAGNSQEYAWRHSKKLASAEVHACPLRNIKCPKAFLSHSLPSQ